MSNHSDDIVTRLRQLSEFKRNHRWGHLLDDWEKQAADEIERLRAEVAYLKQGWYPTPAVVQSYRWWGKEVSDG